MSKADYDSGKRDQASAEGQPETNAQPQSPLVSPNPKQLPAQPKQNTQPPILTCNSSTSCKIPLVGKKTLLKCSLSGYPVTVLFDSGSQVSIIDKTWADTYIPHHTVRPLRELVDVDLNVYGVTGHAIPYDGWVELTVNLTGGDDPNLTIPAPFLVSQLPMPQPLLGANVIEEILKGQDDATVANLLRGAFGVADEQVVAMVNYIRIPPKPDCDPATVRVGKDNIVIPAGKAVNVCCRVPSNFNTSNPLVLYEPTEESTVLGQLSVGEGLLEINNTQRPYVKVPISNHSKHEITLPKRTTLGTIQHVAKVLEADAPELKQVEPASTEEASAEVNNVASLSEPWLPPVDISVT